MIGIFFRHVVYGLGCLQVDADVLSPENSEILHLYGLYLRLELILKVAVQFKFSGLGFSGRSILLFAFCYVVF